MLLEGLTTQALLQRWHGELIRAGLAGTSTLTAGNADTVVSLEQELGRSLPTSYRDFLLACDGMPVTGAFTAGLRSAQRVGWFREREAEWLQIWWDIADDPDNPGPEVALMQRALIVSEPGDEALLLDPDDVDVATGEWACYTFSNSAPGSHRVGMSFRAGLDYMYLDFLAAHRVPSLTLDAGERAVEDAYRSLVAGDLTARDDLEALVGISWRAWLLAAQYDAFGARPHTSRDKSNAVQYLWSGTVGGVSVEQALADRVVVDELIPLWVVRRREAGKRDSDLLHASNVVVERMRSLLAQIADGSGPIADFSYSPAFAASVEQARALVAAGDLEPAWETIREALPTWTPMSRNHVAPLGLYFDKDLRRLLTPPALTMHPYAMPSAGTNEVAVFVSSMAARQSPVPRTAPTVVELPDKKLYSDRTLAVLTTRFETTFGFETTL